MALWVAANIVFSSFHLLLPSANIDTLSYLDFFFFGRKLPLTITLGGHFVRFPTFVTCWRFMSKIFVGGLYTIYLPYHAVDAIIYILCLLAGTRE